MTVNTKKVAGRRELHFDTMDDMQREAERLAGGEVAMLGNWSLPQIFTHLAAGLNSTIDGSSFKAPLYMRLLAPLMKKKFINEGIPPGFTIPPAAQAQFLPPDNIETNAALEDLRAAIQRLKSADAFAKHPLLGKLSKDEIVQFQLRHAEMHLSFAIPAV
jgi:hypothetical protein